LDASDASSLFVFAKYAPAKLKHDLFVSLANAIDKKLGLDPTNPVWVSTNGGGVSWLHIRLDAKPKYYQYEPYKKMLPEGYDAAVKKEAGPQADEPGYEEMMRATYGAPDSDDDDDDDDDE
jgi:hypothetical protein|tara:strand:+ start:1479 stop:1841 length:363 start_codon:yes stop_codon:yes gene_type:complete